MDKVHKQYGTDSVKPLKEISTKSLRFVLTSSVFTRDDLISIYCPIMLKKGGGNAVGQFIQWDDAPFCVSDGKKKGKSVCVGGGGRES